MIKINHQFLNKFIHSHHCYLYQLQRGIYLSFDDETLEYIGLEIYFNIWNGMNKINKEENETLNKLICKGILEI